MNNNVINGFFDRTARITVIYLVLAIFNIFLIIIGGVLNYSEVPFWDMWDGFLEFKLKLEDRHFNAWWEQHNEHRIIITRIIFWLDFVLFNGQNWFLIIINYVLLSFIICVFLQIVKSERKEEYGWSGLFLTVLLTSWSQRENLIWGFQSQFFLAQLLPLITFYLFSKTGKDNRRNTSYFFGSVLFGILSIGTMANGILALPLLLIYALLVGASLSRILLIFFVSLLVTTAYFHNFNFPTQHGSVFHAMYEDPVSFIHYIFLYLGSPIYHILGGGVAAKTIAGFAGFAFTLIVLVITYRTYMQKLAPSTKLSLLFFIAYIGGTAFVTAGGRLVFGVEQALSSRYATPALMAWASLFILCLPSFEKLKGRVYVKIELIFLIFSFLIFASQLIALRPKNDTYFNRDISALALELGVRDNAQLKNIIHTPDLAYSLSEVLVEKNVSIFGIDKFRDLRNELGKKKGALNENNICLGSINEIKPLISDGNFVSVHGWIYDQYEKKVPEKLEFRNEHGVVVGSALTGLKRADVAALYGTTSEFLGFKGYILTEKSESNIKMTATSPGCYFTFEKPRMWLDFKNNTDDFLPVVSLQSISENVGWTGSDFQKSGTDDYPVFGSYINSDRDMGSITLRIKRGDHLHYRSGPTQGRQELEIVSINNSTKVLPTAENWVILEFSNSELPQEFEIQISDFGDGWGEWSAVKLKASNAKLH